jgi:CRISPR-associated protein Cas2
LSLLPFQLDFEFSNAPGLDRHRVIIAYDSPNNRRRRKLARCALSYGERVQQSVFEANLTDAQLRVLARTLESLTQPGEDDVRLYPQCVRCAALCHVIGLQPCAHASSTAAPDLRLPTALAAPRLVVA